uniref:G domain-containing protein n=1 Tax=Strongyloides venezuelensis TaxID=75913 RepID=A0A0K0G179_STRVS
MVNSNTKNGCYIKHENVNHKCLHCRLKVSKEKFSLHSENYLEGKKKFNKENKVLMDESCNDKIRYDIEIETKKYLERIFYEEICSRNTIRSQINKECKEGHFNFNTFSNVSTIRLDNERINYLLKVYYNMHFHLKPINNINQNICMNGDIFRKRDKQNGGIIFLNDIPLKYLLNVNKRNTILIYNQFKNLFNSFIISDILFSTKLLSSNVKCYERNVKDSLMCIRRDNLKSVDYKKSIDLNIQPLERLIIANNSLAIKETVCCHTMIKKVVIGGCQSSSFNDKNILIFGMENSNKSMFINQVFHFLYQWKDEDVRNFFVDKIYGVNKSTDICIYEFNNTNLPYKTTLIDCPEYKINHDSSLQFTSKKLYKDFLRKYVTSKGYFVLSSVVIAVENEDDLVNYKFQRQIKKLTYLFGKSNNYYIFEECLNGKLKWYEEGNNFDVSNNISEYFKKLESNYKVLVRLP